MKYRAVWVTFSKEGTFSTVESKWFSDKKEVEDAGKLGVELFGFDTYYTLETREDETQNSDDQTAKDMFEQLGYIQTIHNSEEYDHRFDGIQYTKEDEDIKESIEFYFYHKEIFIEHENKKHGIAEKKDTVGISLEELKAIIKQTEELQWNAVPNGLIELGKRKPKIDLERVCSDSKDQDLEE